MIDFDAPAEDYNDRPSDTEFPDESPEECQRKAEAMWKASAICATATGLVAGDRERTHGNKRLNFTNIAMMWNAILAAKCAQAGLPPLIALDAHDVANMMEAMKIARRYTGTVNRDDYVDGAGYAGVAAEVVVRKSD